MLHQTRRLLFARQKPAAAGEVDHPGTERLEPRAAIAPVKLKADIMGRTEALCSLKHEIPLQSRCPGIMKNFAAGGVPLQKQGERAGTGDHKKKTERAGHAGLHKWLKFGHK